MVAKSNAVPDPDEDIIELTDIIEQGTSPAPAAFAPHTDDPLRDLLHTGNKEEENDLDALLAEIGSPPQATPEDLLGQTMQHAVNPDETLDMPDMREVESLLDELDIPAQTPALADAAAAEQNAGEDLDDIINQFSAAASAPATPAAAPDPASDLDALLDGVVSSAPAAASAAQTTQPSITVRASDTLPEPAAKPVAPVPPAAAAVAMDDLDALLGNTAATKPAPSEISEPPNLTGDLDAFLESIPPTSPKDDVDETLPPLPEQAAADTAVTRASGPAPADSAPAFVRPARDVAVTEEKSPLPRQWDNLLGHAPEPGPAVQPSEGTSGAVPLEMLELRLAHIETRLTELSAAMGSTEQRVHVLEETLQQITTAQSESAGQDSPELQALHTLVQGMEERFERWETRLDKLERGSKEELERAAAAAAARILREELAAILAEEAK